MNRTEFRDKILKLLTTSIDNYSFEKSENSAVINVNTPEDGTIEIGLTNLYRVRIPANVTVDSART